VRFSLSNFNPIVTQNRKSPRGRNLIASKNFWAALRRKSWCYVFENERFGTSIMEKSTLGSGLFLPQSMALFESICKISGITYSASNKTKS
jgi:hypothetical protein